MLIKAAVLSWVILRLFLIALAFSGDFTERHLHELVDTGVVTLVITFLFLAFLPFVLLGFLVSLRVDDLADDLVLVIVARLVQSDQSTLQAAIFVLLDHVGPGLALEQRLRVADHEQEVPRPGHRDIETADISEEAQTSLNSAHRVRSNTVEDDDVFLSALERINCVDFHVPQDAAHLSQVRPEGVLEVLNLRPVRRHDRDLVFQALRERATLTCNLVDEPHKVERELDLIHVDFRHVLYMFARLLEVKEDAPADHFRQRLHVLV